MALGKPQSDLFDEAAASLLGMVWRPELTVEEIPAPQRIAPFAAAIAADVDSDEEEVGNGRLVLLHDPDGNPAWEGTFRCVTFARASVDPEMAADPLLAEVGWSWLIEALEAHSAAFAAPSGTVTAVSSRSFGTMAEDLPRVEIEIRASWTPQIERGAEIAAHVQSWQDLLCLTAGLPVVPEGVVAIPTWRSGKHRP